MAVQSDLKSCLMWVTERPFLDRTRKSSYFSLFGEEWYFQICLEIYNHLKYTCRVRLYRRSGRITLETPIRITCCAITPNLFLKDLEDFGNERPFKNSGGVIFECDLLKDSLSTSSCSENWTLFIRLRSAQPLSLQLNDETILLSTVRDENPKPLTIDRSVQATPETPPDIRGLSADKSVQATLEIPPDIGGLSADISTLLQNEIFPDFRIQCRGRTFLVHRSVLASRSEVFQAMLQNQMLEKESGMADIEDLEVPVLESLLKFVYSGKLEPVSENTVSRIYEAADKYAVHRLKEACSSWMIWNLSKENCVGFLDVADSHCDSDLRASVVSFIMKHPDVLKTTAWLTFSKQHQELTNEILQMYVSSIIQ